MIISLIRMIRKRLAASEKSSRGHRCSDEFERWHLRLTESLRRGRGRPSKRRPAFTDLSSSRCRRRAHRPGGAPWNATGGAASTETSPRRSLDAKCRCTALGSRHARAAQVPVEVDRGAHLRP